MKLSVIAYMANPAEATTAPPAAPPKKIACAFYHNLSICNVGEDKAFSVYSWGRNQYRVCGMAKANEEKPAPTKITAPKSEAYEVACGLHHTVILVKNPKKEGGDLYCYGLGNHGRLGCKEHEVEDDNPVEDVWHTTDAPRKVSFRMYPDAQIIRVACGGDHTICLSSDAKLYSFGMNNDGQLGIGNYNDAREPKLIEDISKMEIVHFACGARHSLACSADGQLFSWGYKRNGRLGLGGDLETCAPCIITATSVDMKFVAAGEGHSGAIDKDDCVWMWGAGSYGRLGLGDEQDALIPRKMDIKVKQLALGAFHGLALTGSPQKLFSWGVGCAVGLLSENDNTVITAPRQIIEPQTFTAPITQIACGTFHCLVLMSGGALVSWGLGANGRLGHGNSRNVPQPKAIAHPHRGFCVDGTGGVPATKFTDVSEQRHKAKDDADDDPDAKKAPWAVKQLACGATHTSVLTHGGHCYIWGSAENGKLGMPPKEGSQPGRDSGVADLWFPKRLPFEKLIRELALGYDHCLAVTTDNALFAWGKGDRGQLGTGRPKDCPEPTHVESLKNLVVTCGAGEEHSAAICRGIGSGNILQSWGSAESGKLGLGSGFTAGAQPTPSRVSLPPTTDSPGAVQVRCGQSHTAILMDLGDSNALYTFGGGWYGRLGHGSPSNEYAPKMVKLEHSVNDVQCGAFHTCVITDDENLYVCGRNKTVCEPDDLKLFKKFIHIEGQPKVKDVRCGELHTICITEGGDVWVWGNNASKQLALDKGGRKEEYLPVQARSFQGVVAMISTGPGHAVGMLGNGEVYGWGNQSCGRLGLVQRVEPDKYVATPHKVRAEWASIEAMSGAVAAKEEDEESEEEEVPGTESKQEDKPEKGQDAAEKEQMKRMLDSIREGQKVQQFFTMQTLLKQEQEDAKEHRLEKREKELIDELQVFLNAIRKLPDEEKAVKQLQSTLKQSLFSNLKYFRDAQAPDAAKPCVLPKIMATLMYYEELLWVLQQQACYLAQLSMCIEGDEERCEIFYRIVDAIYAELTDARTLHLFLAMIKLMIDKEIEHAKQCSHVFHWKTSRVFKVFQRFALKDIHYKSSVHQFMDSFSAPTLMSKLKHASCERFEVFSIRYKDYRDSLGGAAEPGGGMDDQEINAAFNANLEKFKDFMGNDFLVAIKRSELHENLRKIFSHSIQEIQNRQFTMDSSDVSIPPELKICEPLLSLFLMGMILPMLQDLKRYMGKEVFLSKCSADAGKGEIGGNVKILSEFLEKMMHDLDSDEGFSKTNDKFLTSLVKNIKPELLRYVDKQARECHDDTDTQLTVDVYISHFDARKHVVSVQTSDLLKLSNMLKDNENKLRLTEHDVVEEICGKIGSWDNGIVTEISKNDQLHNFAMNSRFLFQFKAMTICRSSHCPVPPFLSATATEGGDGEGQIINRYTSPADETDPRRTLEELFRDLDNLKCKTFPEMKIEFEGLIETYSKSSTPNYEMTNRLAKGLEKLQELQTVEAHPEDVLQFMADSMTARDKHRLYLEEVAAGKDKITAAQTKHAKELEQSMKEYKAALKFSMELKLPEPFSKGGANLKFFEVNERIKNTRSFDPKAMPEGCSYSPTASVKLTKLKKDGTIEEVKIPLQMHPDIEFTFRLISTGGVEVTCNMKKGKSLSTMKDFEISQDEMQDMKRKEGHEKATLGKGFIICNAAKMTNLLTKIATGS